VLVDQLASAKFSSANFKSANMLYLVGKLSSKLEHIKILTLCVDFKGFIAEDKFI